MHLHIRPEVQRIDAGILDLRRSFRQQLGDPPSRLVPRRPAQCEKGIEIDVLECGAVRNQPTVGHLIQVEDVSADCHTDAVALAGIEDTVRKVVERKITPGGNVDPGGSHTGSTPRAVRSSTGSAIEQEP